MNRTRTIFFIFLAIYLAVILAALALGIASPAFVRLIFIASTVFSVGVVLLDFFGVLGGHHGGETSGGETSGGETSGDVTAGHLGGDHTAADLVGAGHPDAAGHATGDQSGPIHHGPDQQGAGPILSALSYLRLFVYFCLGFGPMGLVALATGRNAFASLLFAIPVGVAAVFLAQAFFRFQRQDTDSQLTSADLVGQTGTVIVPLDDKTMGKVRILVGPVVAEQYALAAHPGAAFKNGDQVMISSVTDECVYVR
jgi:membrane protein implicated in regulation of membrane protease activity